MPSMARVMSIAMLVLGTFAVGALFFRLMAGFFVPLFLAALLVVLFRPFHLWVFERVGRRAHLAALTTTGVILLIVLLPVLAVFSVAASQATRTITRMSPGNLQLAMQRAREQFAVDLPHADQFRKLDQTLTELERLDALEAEQLPQTMVRLDRARKLIAYLQTTVPGPAAAKPLAETARDQLTAVLAQLVVSTDAESLNVGSPDAEALSLDDLDAEPLELGQAGGNRSSIEDAEQLDAELSRAVMASQSWLRLKLGGSLRSQLKLLANPTEEQFSELVRGASEFLQPRFVRLTSATGGFLVQLVIGLCILVISVYFFLIDGPGMIRTLMRLSPLDDYYERRLLLQFDRTSRAVVLASVLSALAQGVLAAIAYYFLDFGAVVLLFLITCMLALVPFLGAAAVWAPCAIWLGAVEQRWGAALFLAIYGALVISSIDNVIKAYVLHGRSQLHPLLALLSVLGGVSVFGPIGILVGPMVVVFLQTLLEILNHELGVGEGEPKTRTSRQQSSSIAG